MTDQELIVWAVQAGVQVGPNDSIESIRSLKKTSDECAELARKNNEAMKNLSLATRHSILNALKGF